MSFFLNFQSDKCPGTISSNPMNGLCEKVCLQAEKVFDACIKQTQLEGYMISVSSFTPASPALPLTFISARSASGEGTVTSTVVDRDEKGCSRVQCTVSIPMEVIYTDANGADGVATGNITINEDVLLFVPAPSVMPYRITATVSAVSPQGTYNETSGNFVISCCTTVILRVTMPVDILLPCYGYCAIPPAQEYSQEVCSGFFELPLYPQGRSCSRS